MQFAHRDFAPSKLSAAGFFSGEDYDTFEAAVAAANTWIAAEGIDVLNIETVVLPNIWDPREEGTVDPDLLMSGKRPTSWHQFIRVWYRVA